MVAPKDVNAWPKELNTLAVTPVKAACPSWEKEFVVHRNHNQISNPKVGTYKFMHARAHTSAH